MTQDQVLTQTGEVDGRSTGERQLGQSLLRGSLCRCPACGSGKLFHRYLKVADHCSECDEALHHHRADDAPPYFTVSIVGHIIVAMVLWVEMAYQPAFWMHAALWMPLTLIMALLMLPPIKGALVGLQWALLMHGFDPHWRDELTEIQASLNKASDQGAA